MKLTIQNNINFLSGLNNKIIKESQNINIHRFENTLYQNQNIDIECNNCKPIAYCIQKTIAIFEILKQKTQSTLFNLNTPRIRIFDNNNLVEKPPGYNFCIPETRTVLKNEPPFETGSLFFEKEISLEELDKKINKSFQQNNRSSSHFLAPTIHEILHSSYLDMIYKKYSYNGKCPYTSQKYHTTKQSISGLDILEILQQKTFTEAENKILSNILGYYSINPINQYHEVFAETFTQLICSVLSANNALPIQNPLDKLRTYPKEFLNILLKVLNI